MKDRIIKLEPNSHIGWSVASAVYAALFGVSSVVLTFMKSASLTTTAIVAILVVGSVILGIKAVLLSDKASRLSREGSLKESMDLVRKIDVYSLCAAVLCMAIWLGVAVFILAEGTFIAYLFALLIMGLFGAITALEGKDRKCGMTGGFILGSFGMIFAWVLIRVIDEDFSPKPAFE